MLDKLKHILISRTDAIGDVMLTLPMVGYLKQLYPHLRITFIGNTYTKPILDCCTTIDAVLVYAELEHLSTQAQLKIIKDLNADAIVHVFPNKAIANLAKQAKIPYRVGTSRRLFHLTTCNRLVNLSRKNSDFHEAELNILLLKGLGVSQFPQLSTLSQFYQFKVSASDTIVSNYISKTKTNIILHTKSKGSAREWGLDHFAELIQTLSKDDYNVILTGTEQEGQLFRAQLVAPFSHVHDTSGQFSLSQLVQLIQASQILIAASTGPLHIAAALGKKAIGLYAPMRPLFPKRWAPIGANTVVLVVEKNCDACRKSGVCQCIMDIEVSRVVKAIRD
jgi:heptosyltransferase III